MEAHFFAWRVCLGLTQTQLTLDRVEVNLTPALLEGLGRTTLWRECSPGFSARAALSGVGWGVALEYEACR